MAPLVPPTKRSCDQCRRRKVKCSGSAPPCESCAVASLDCSYLITPKKRGPKFHSEKTESMPDRTETNMRRTSTTSSTVIPHRPPTYSPSASHAYSPSSVLALNSAVSGKTIRDVRAKLEADIATVLTQPLDKVITQCIDLYLNHLFAITPVIHENSIREYNASWTQGHTAYPSPDPEDYAELLASIRKYALLTTVCAVAAFVLPQSLFADGSKVQHAFLHASRSLLASIADLDLEKPVSSSVITRYLQNICLHAAGKHHVSWHVMGGAIRIAQDMRLHDDSCYQGLDEVEAQLRRNIYWQLRTGDRSSAILQECPMTMHDDGFDSHISIPPAPTNDNDCHLLTCRRNDGAQVEAILNVGYNVCQSLWSYGAKILLHFEGFENVDRSRLPTVVVEHRLSEINEMYLHFVGLLDDAPQYLQNPTSVLEHPESIHSHMIHHFWVQHVNLFLTFHCLRVMMFQKAEDFGMCSVLGLTADPTMSALRKTEVGHDVLSVLRRAPFQSLQVNGESCVEKIRKVGAVLLKVAQTCSNKQISQRAESGFRTLLDLLASMNSKASDDC